MPAATANIRAELLAHRFRGFDAREGTVKGLRAALAGGARHVECDLRVTRDGVLVVHHDPFFFGAGGVWANLSAIDYRDLIGQPDLANVARLDDILEVFAAQAPPDARLHLDFKVVGIERDVVARLNHVGVLDRTVFVSWIPTTLMDLHALAPRTPLCFSHISLHRYPGLFALARHLGLAILFAGAAVLVRPFNPHLAEAWLSTRPFFDADGDPVAAAHTDDTRLKNHAHVVPHAVTGPLRAALVATQGYVCLPRWCACADLSADYRRDGIRTAVFSAQSAADVATIARAAAPDLIYVDDAAVIRAAATTS